MVWQNPALVLFADAEISVCRPQRCGLGALEDLPVGHQPSAAPGKIVAVKPPAGLLKIAHGFSRGFSILPNFRVSQGRKKCREKPDFQQKTSILAQKCVGCPRESTHCQREKVPCRGESGLCPWKLALCHWGLRRCRWANAWSPSATASCLWEMLYCPWELTLCPSAPEDFPSAEAALPSARNVFRWNLGIYPWPTFQLQAQPIRRQRQNSRLHRQSRNMQLPRG